MFLPLGNSSLPPSVVEVLRLCLASCYSLQSGAQPELMERLYSSVAPYCKDNPTTRQPR